jgi:hypothetical protein
MRLRADAETRRLWVAIETTFGVFVFAHLARCAAAIRARPAAEIPRLLDAPLEFSADIALLRRSS